MCKLPLASQKVDKRVMYFTKFCYFSLCGYHWSVLHKSTICNFCYIFCEAFMSCEMNMIREYISIRNDKIQEDVCFNNTLVYQSSLPRC